MSVKQYMVKRLLSQQCPCPSLFLISDNIIRVSSPALSRRSHDCSDALPRARNTCEMSLVPVSHKLPPVTCHLSPVTALTIIYFKWQAKHL